MDKETLQLVILALIVYLIIRECFCKKEGYNNIASPEEEFEDDMPSDIENDLMPSPPMPPSMPPPMQDMGDMAPPFPLTEEDELLNDAHDEICINGSCMRLSGDKKERILEIAFGKMNSSTPHLPPMAVTTPPPTNMPPLGIPEPMPF